jgi:hypothetical protein
MFESAEGLLTACTRQNDGRLGIVTVSETFSDPARTSVEATTVASPNVRPFRPSHAPFELAATGRSGLCAETRATAKNAAKATPDAHLSTIATSVRLVGVTVSAGVYAR